MVALALVVASCASEDGETAPVTTAGPVGATSSTAPTTVAPPTTSLPATTTTTTEAPDPAPRDVWTAVLASVPVANATRTDAATIAAELGVDAANVFASDDYDSLEPGFWVVFADTYDDRRSAGNACFEYRDIAPDCYPRYLGSDPTLPFGPDSGQLLAVADGELVVLSTATGRVLRTIDPYWEGDGVFPDVPHAVAGTTTGYVSAGFEDFWFSCEASSGSLRSIDLTNGIVTELTDGISPVVSPDGSAIAYLRAGSCVPDPEVDGFWVVFFDTVVVRELASGEEREFTVDEPEQMTPESDLAALAWSRDGEAVYVLDGFAQVHRLDLAVGGSPIQTLVAPSLGEGARLIGETSDGIMLYATTDFTAGTSALLELDLETGERSLSVAYPAVATFALDVTGSVLAVQFGDLLDVGGVRVPSPVTVTAISW